MIFSEKLGKFVIIINIKIINIIINIRDIKILRNIVSNEYQTSSNKLTENNEIQLVKKEALGIALKKIYVFTFINIV